jgi:hypothetical protein
MLGASTADPGDLTVRIQDPTSQPFDREPRGVLVAGSRVRGASA